MGAVWNWNDKKRLLDPEALISQKDLIRIFLGGPKTPGLVLSPRQVIYEDPHLLCVFKPAGVHCQPTPQSMIHSLDYGVTGYLKSQGLLYTAQTLHRLDAPVEGLVWFAKNKNAEKALHRLFAERKIRKFYLAAVPENPLFPMRAVLKTPIEESPGVLKPAETRILKIKTHAGVDFFALSLKTGRFHQIRRHFKAHLAPLSGDREYGSLEKGPLRLLCADYRLIHPVTQEKLKIFYLPQGFFKTHLPECAEKSRGIPD